MIKFLLLIFLTLPAFSAVRIEVSSITPVVTQGELLEVSLDVQADSPAGLELQKLKGTTVGEVVYFYEVSPLFRKEGEKRLQAEGKIIFVKVPEANTIKTSFSGGALELVLRNLEVRPIQAAQTYQFGHFEIPKPSQWLWWGLATLGVLLIGGLIGVPVARRINKKRKHKAHLENMKSQVLGCRTYDDVVELWKSKHLYLKIFPHLQDPFSRLEEVLNKYQFKQFQSQAERQEVLESYRKFTASVEGGFIGI